MILSTTPAIDGKLARCHLGVVGAEVILGANAWRDLVANVVDIIGGRNKQYEQVFESARQQALEILEAKATARGGNAVVNIRFDYHVLGENNGMLMVAVTGTAVILNLTEEETAREEVLARVQAPAYSVQIDGRDRGPFSAVQLRDLVTSGKIAEGLGTRLESGEAGPSVGEVTARLLRER